MEGRDLHKEILDTARRLFIAQGYRGLSMREIALALDVSKPALYYHFKDKEELFLAILMEYLGELEELLNGIVVNGRTCREQIWEFVSTILRQPCEKRALIRLGSNEVTHLSEPARQSFSKAYQEQFIAKLQDILRRGMESGELRSMDVSMAAWALLGIVYPYLYPTESSGELLMEDVIDTLISVYFDGMTRR